MPYVYSRPYLRLFLLTYFPGPTFIPCPTSIPDSRVYGRENLALIHVMIQSSYVTKIKRDVAMKLTGFIANTGGLLGLCLGFSFISCIEFVFLCGCYCFKSKCSH